jgi:uncharacterized protein
MDDDVVERLTRAAPAALGGLPIRFAYLFGSHATGTAGPTSDIDVAVSVDGDADHLDVVLAAASALEAASGLRPVDVVVLESLPLRFVGRILRQRIVLYCVDDPTRVAYESLQSRMADDVEVWAAPMDREILARMAERTG